MFNSSNSREFQKGLDTEKARAKRGDAQLSLRRKQREARLEKKVRLFRNKPSSSAGEGTEAQPIRHDIPTRHDIPKYIANIMQSDKIPLQLYGLCSLRKLLATDRDPPAKRICDCGILPKVIQFMYNNNNYNTDIFDELAFEAAWTITNISAANKECSLKVVGHGAIEAFADLLRVRGRHNMDIATQTIWGLGNIAADGSEAVQRIFNTGVTKDIVEIIDESSNLNSDLQKNAIWAISNMMRFRNAMKVKELKEIKLMPVLCRLLTDNIHNQLQLDNEGMRDCLWTLNYLSNQSEEICCFMVQEGIINVVMKLMNNEVRKYGIVLDQSNDPKKGMLSLDHNIYRPILRFLGNILSCDDHLTQIVLDCGYLDIIEPFTCHFLKRQRVEVMWSFSNILAGSHQQIDCVLSRNKLIKSIINCAKNDILCVRNEACFAICNAVNNAVSEQKKKLAEYGAIEALCSLLNPINNISEQNILVIVEGLEMFLQTFGDFTNVNPFAQRIEECQGLDYLETRSADNITEKTWQLIVELMQKYWGELKEQPETQLIVNADIDSNGKQFAFGTNSFSNTHNENNNSVKFNF